MTFLEKLDESISLSLVNLNIRPMEKKSLELLKLKLEIRNLLPKQKPTPLNKVVEEKKRGKNE